MTTTTPYKNRKAKKYYDETDAERFEQIHVILQGHVSSIAGAIVEMRKSMHPLLRGVPWSFSYLEEMMETEAYRQWRTDYINFMKCHAEVEAYRILANPAILNQQVMANLAVAVSRNNLAKAKEYIDAKRAAGALKVNEGEDEPSAVAALLGVE
jgi:hypothetical protein